MTVVEAENLSFEYREGESVLHGVSFRVGKGETLVVSGLSGSGKTTLCQLISGIIPRAAGERAGGIIKVADINPIKAGPIQTALRVGFVFQDADSQIICQAVEDEIAFGLENLCVSPPKIRQRVDNLLHEFRLYEKREQNPADLSGGQKKLLTIASVLALDPPVLVLDEPMCGLDDEARSIVHAAIERQKRRGRAIIITGHDTGREWSADYRLKLQSVKPLKQPSGISGILL